MPFLQTIRIDFVEETPSSAMLYEILRARNSLHKTLLYDALGGPLSATFFMTAMRHRHHNPPSIPMRQERSGSSPNPSLLHAPAQLSVPVQHAKLVELFAWLATHLQLHLTTNNLQKEPHPHMPPTEKEYLQRIFLADPRIHLLCQANPATAW